MPADKTDITQKMSPPTISRHRRTTARRQWLAAVMLAWTASLCYGDNLADARRLLEISDVAREFERATLEQSRKIIRTYSSIVAMSTEQELPVSIKREIARCYQETFAWERFEPGIAAIFAENLSATELRLLIDFFNDKSVPPPMIGRFKEIVARAEAIEQLAIDYMFSQTEGCDARNVELILGYLADQGS